MNSNDWNPFSVSGFQPPKFHFNPHPFKASFLHPPPISSVFFLLFLHLKIFFFSSSPLPPLPPPLSFYFSVLPGSFKRTSFSLQFSLHYFSFIESWVVLGDESTCFLRQIELKRKKIGRKMATKREEFYSDWIRERNDGSRRRKE